jgi:hypothetical protein
VIKPYKNAKLRSKGCTAWSKNISECQKLGYEEWAKKTGYSRKRFSEEHAFEMFITKYGTKLEEGTLSELIFHNLHTFPYHQFLSQKEEVSSPESMGRRGSPKTKITLCCRVPSPPTSFIYER